jgi:E3 ubiquitin-protein ligase DRIP
MEEGVSALSRLKDGLNMEEVEESWTRDQMRTFVGSLGCEKVSWKREQLQDQIKAVSDAFKRGWHGAEDLKGVADNVSLRHPDYSKAGEGYTVPTKSARSGGNEAASMMAEEGEAERRMSKRANNIKNALTCPLCHELFKEATTVTECLHTFCRACIIPKIKVGTNTNTCPFCSKPIAPDPYACKQIIFDRTLDDIVTKLFPREGDLDRSKLREQRSLEEQEMKRRLKVQAGPKPKRPRLSPPQASVKSQRMMSADHHLRHQHQHQPSTSKAAAATTGGLPRSDTIMKIRIDRAEGSRHPQLRKCFFKVYPNVTIKTLTNHVVKRLEKTLGGQKLPADEILELYIPCRATQSINEQVSIASLYMATLHTKNKEAGGWLTRLEPDKDNSVLALEYKERPVGSLQPPPQSQQVQQVQQVQQTPPPLESTAVPMMAEEAKSNSAIPVDLVLGKAAN